MWRLARLYISILFFFLAGGGEETESLIRAGAFIRIITVPETVNNLRPKKATSEILINDSFYKKKNYNV